MDAVGIALIVSSCLVCSGVLLAGGVLLLMWQDRWARRGPPTLEAQQGAPVQAVAGQAPGDPVAGELAVDPGDAARTERWLHELMVSGRLKDW